MKFNEIVVTRIKEAFLEDDVKINNLEGYKDVTQF
jgi:hypothetical protein